MYEMIKEFIKPEFLILIPVLFAFGIMLKKSAMVDWLIPYVLTIFSVLLCLLWSGATTTISNIQDGCMMIFTSIVQGFLCAAASTMVDQYIKQAQKKD